MYNSMLYPTNRSFLIVKLKKLDSHTVNGFKAQNKIARLSVNEIPKSLSLANKLQF